MVDQISIETAQSKLDCSMLARLPSKQIVLGAVSMVEMALNGLTERGVVELDAERRAAMVSNLLVVLCAETEAQPVINAGTLYS
jgi:hypothetical protein